MTYESAPRIRGGHPQSADASSKHATTILTPVALSPSYSWWIAESGAGLVWLGAVTASLRAPRRAGAVTGGGPHTLVIRSNASDAIHSLVRS